jgi:hypothetical protein
MARAPVVYRQFREIVMIAQLGAIPAAVRSVVERLFRIKFRTSVGIAVTALALGGCLPRTVPLAGADPADPGAKVAGVGYHSTIAPYTSLRPTAPSSWREQNDRVAPAPKSNQ